MEKLSIIHKLEKAVVMMYNLDGWDLEWCGGEFEHYDAKGKTPKGFDCIMEMKFRDKYYETKLLEKYKYDKMFQEEESIVKLYFVNDTKANYLFWLNDIKLPKVKKLWAPTTTLWNQKKREKEVYLLKESLSVRTIRNIEF